MRTGKQLFRWIVVAMVLEIVLGRCRYNIDEKYMPFHVDSEPF